VGGPFFATRFLWRKGRARLTSNAKFVQDYGELQLTSSPRPALSFSTDLRRGGTINLVVPSGTLPRVADETSLSESVIFRPNTRLQITNSYLLDRVIYRSRDQAVFNDHILRTKWNLQWSRSLSFRAIAQLNNLLANPVNSSLRTTRSLNLDFLIAYLVHPGTAVYVGYNTDMANLDRNLCLRQPSGLCDSHSVGLLRSSDGLINDSRQVFVKVSYLLRR
jgi:hypothetical protein